MCEPNNCNCKQDFHKCNCTALYKIRYVKDEKEGYTNREFKSIDDFKRFCDVSNIDYYSFDIVELMVE